MRLRFDLFVLVVLAGSTSAYSSNNSNPRRGPSAPVGPIVVNSPETTDQQQRKTYAVYDLEQSSSYDGHYQNQYQQQRSRRQSLAVPYEIPDPPPSPREETQQQQQSMTPHSPSPHTNNPQEEDGSPSHSSWKRNYSISDQYSKAEQQGDSSSKRSFQDHIKQQFEKYAREHPEDSHQPSKTTGSQSPQQHSPSDDLEDSDSQTHQEKPFFRPTHRIPKTDEYYSDYSYEQSNQNMEGSGNAAEADYYGDESSFNEMIDNHKNMKMEENRQPIATAAQSPEIDDSCYDGQYDMPQKSSEARPQTEIKSPDSPSSWSNQTSKLNIFSTKVFNPELNPSSRDYERHPVSNRQRSQPSPQSTSGRQDLPRRPQVPQTNPKTPHGKTKTPMSWSEFAAQHRKSPTSQRSQARSSISVDSGRGGDSSRSYKAPQQSSNARISQHTPLSTPPYETHSQKADEPGSSWVKARTSQPRHMDSFGYPQPSGEETMAGQQSSPRQPFGVPKQQSYHQQSQRSPSWTKDISEDISDRFAALSQQLFHRDEQAFRGNADEEPPQNTPGPHQGSPSWAKDVSKQVSSLSQQLFHHDEETSHDREHKDDDSSRQSHGLPSSWTSDLTQDISDQFASLSQQLFHHDNQGAKQRTDHMIDKESRDTRPQDHNWSAPQVLDHFGSTSKQPFHKRDEFSHQKHGPWDKSVHRSTHEASVPHMRATYSVNDTFVAENQEASDGDWKHSWEDQYRAMVPFKQAKVRVASYGIKSKEEYMKMVKEKKFGPYLPKDPERMYTKEWVSWPDFLGQKNLLGSFF